jgi:succinate dehydrogenase / fumarate reductase, cytochrome b subunit
VSASALFSSSGPLRKRWARLHSLTGAVPLAGFLVLHLSAQSSALWGWQQHRQLSEKIDQLPLVAVLEIVCVYLPLAAHLALSVLGRNAAEDNAAEDQAKPAADTLPVLLPRLSAAALFVFLAFHLWQFRWRLWTGQIDRADVFPELVATLSSTVSGGIPVTAAVYLVGIAAAAFHGARSVFAVCCEWQLLPAKKLRALGLACGAAGVACFLLGATVVIHLATGSALLRFPG